MARETLRQGDSGADVKKLQEALRNAGFNPGLADGVFGGGTQAAVLAFQISEGLLADGIAGPRTQAALGLARAGQLPDVTSEVTVQVVSQMCPFTPLGNIKASLPVLIDALRAAGLFHRTMVLVAMATIRAETESFMPVAEGQSRFNTSPGGHAFDLYDNRKDLGNKGAPDGRLFRGRGFIQLTGRFNYAKYGPRLATPMDLAANPELACATSIAAELLCCFLGDRELQIKDALMNGNLQAARRLVNGGLNGLDRFREAYETGDRLLSPAFQ
jgi:peptidoglycan L-alanyl-D-glutamate endopeptidase CwlK